MAVTAYKSPASCGGIYAAWDNPTNAYASDDAYAEANHAETEQFATFGFTTTDIPTGSTINGFEVATEAHVDSGDSWVYFIRLTKDGTTFYTLTTNSGNSPTITSATDVTVVSGAATDLAGTTWSVAQVTASTFGCYARALKGSGSGTIIYCDHIKIRIYFTPPPTAWEKTITSSIGLIPAINKGLTKTTTASLGLKASINKGLTKTVSGILGLTGSRRKWQQTSPDLVSSGWEKFTPNEDLTPLEWAVYVTTDHFDAVDQDVDAVVLDGYNAFIEGIYPQQDKLGFTAPTAPTGAYYKSLVIRVYVVNTVVGEQRTTLNFTAYAGGNTIGTASVYPFSLYRYDVAIPNLNVSKADMASLQLMMESGSQAGWGMNSEYFFVYALDIIGYWEKTPNTKDLVEIESTGSMTTSVSSSTGMTITVNSKD